MENIGSIRSDSSGWESSNGSCQGAALTIILIGTTLIPELLAVLISNTGVTNRGQPIDANMDIISMGRAGIELIILLIIFVPPI